MCGWSDLHSSLLLSIFERLLFVDVLRAKSVCSSWYSSAKDYLSSFSKANDPLQIPWLLLPPKDEKDIDSCRFFNLQEKRVYNFKNMPKGFSNSRCIGSSNGWLILLDDRANPFLLNPFTRERIQLPSIDTFGEEGKVVKREEGKEYEVRIKSRPYSVLKSAKELRNTFILKAILWTGKQDFGVVVIYDDNRVAYCRPADKKWTDLDSKGRLYCDMIYQDSQLYVISCTGGVEIWDYLQSSSVFKKRMDIGPSIPWEFVEVMKSLRDFRGVKFYSVKSNGDLLMIARWLIDHNENVNINNLDDELCWGLNKSYRTCIFQVYSMDFDEKVWAHVGNLGNRVVFLGGNHSMTLLAGDFPECEENSIYFTDDCWHDMDSLVYGGYDMGIFNLKDGSIKPFYQCDLRRILPPPFWVIPNLAEHDA